MWLNSREWDEPNARDMGRMTSQPDAKGEMYILNDGIDMKAEIAAMERRLDELEMNQMQPVQAISQHHCKLCLVPFDHPNFSWKPQPPQYQQPAQAPQQASNLEQTMVNLCKVVGDFIEKQEATNARVDQRIDRMESMLNKRMDEMQNDYPKLDILQDSISRLANLNTMQEKENSPSQPYQNSMSFWMIKIKRNCKEIEEKNRSKIGAKSESNGPKTGEKQGKNRGLRDFAASAKSKFCCETSSQPNCPLCENFRSCETNLAHECHFAAQWPPFRSCESGCEPPKHEILHFAGKAPFAGYFAAAKPILAHECHFAAQEHPFRSCETHCEVVKPDFAPKVPFRRVFRNCEGGFGTRVPFRSTVTPISQLRNGCEVPK
ncbi:hypothetical protein CK203_000046 [Vitis vinifera]|uniref:Uncharacterized protein n=1 Tax=Vitis vinifera TaxID=29760 RepID=A0A438KPN8_VITVI|nr:hypothetical protein CK203_000046 [Vitis vinifera]